MEIKTVRFALCCSYISVLFEMHFYKYACKCNMVIEEKNWNWVEHRLRVQSIKQELGKFHNDFHWTIRRESLTQIK